MSKQQLYQENTRLSDLICGNFNLLLMMSRFGISLGFGDSTVKEVCEKNHVDTKTFLAIINFMDKEYITEEYSPEDLSLETIISFLQRAHSYFLDFNLPAIRRKLIDAMDYTQGEITVLVLKFFDTYVDEVRKHMEYENKTVFKYADALLKGEDTKGYQIDIFESRHNHISEKLTDLKNIIIKYYPASVNANQINSVLFDIFNCEQDLDVHCKVEDYIFVPLIKQIENTKR